MFTIISSLFDHIGFNEQVSIYLTAFVIIAILIGISVLANMLAKRVIVGSIHRMLNTRQNVIAQALLNYNVFHRLSHIAPILVIYYGVESAFDGGGEQWVDLIAFTKKLSLIYITAMTAFILDACLNAGSRVYRSFEISKEISIRSYVQVVKIFIYTVAAISSVSILLDKNPGYFIGGLGAMTAVIMLVFKDTILGLVASFQLSANQLVRPGDWIEMPNYKADGDVLDISLTTVRVQNWDKTITSIPTYALVNDSFKNWRGMSESGGRRIKRHISIDMNSVKFCDPEMIDRLRKIQLLSNHIETKLSEIAAYNEAQGIDPRSPVNGRQLTNLGVFRAYLESYLRNHPKVHQDLTFLVRQLQPNEKGIPLEVYIFLNDQRWANYEGIQADIFDHILAVIPEFELHVFQNLSGADLRSNLAHHDNIKAFPAHYDLPREARPSS